MTKADVAPLFEIPAGTLDKWDVDYLDGLLEALAEFPPDDEGHCLQARLRPGAVPRPPSVGESSWDVHSTEPTVLDAVRRCFDDVAELR